MTSLLSALQGPLYLRPPRIPGFDSFPSAEPGIDSVLIRARFLSGEGSQGDRLEHQHLMEVSEDPSWPSTLSTFRSTWCSCPTCRCLICALVGLNSGGEASEKLAGLLPGKLRKPRMEGGISESPTPTSHHPLPERWYGLSSGPDCLELEDKPVCGVEWAPFWHVVGTVPVISPVFRQAAAATVGLSHSHTCI